MGKVLILFLFVLLLITFINCTNNKILNNENSSNEDNVINVFLIPHSHCDLGWVQTLEEYYSENVTVILDNVINTLIKDSSKKFNWAEIYYFETWWNEQSSFLQAQVRNLVNNGQLYFVGGGWAQNDEGATHYQAVINQMTLGHQFLLSEFGVVPEIGWQIDPFGPSTLTATLFSLMGFKYHVINRIDERIKYIYNDTPDIVGSGWMTTDRSFEFQWYPSHNDQELSIFTHVLDHHYNSPYLIYPNASNPNQSLTTGFDFESDPTQNPPINQSNIYERAAVFVEIMQQRSQLYRHNNLLIPFGNDFRFQNASLEFDNMDKLITYINSNSSWGVTIQYATLNEYFEKVESIEPPVEYADIVGQDLFVYTMCLASDYQAFNTCANWWSGYYTSYPLLKQTARDSDSLLRVGEMLYSLSCFYSNGFDFDFNIGFYALSMHRNVSGILTHHDAITGTAKEYVRVNYFQMLNEAQSLTLDYNIPDFVGFLLSNKSLNIDYQSNGSSILNSTNPGDIIAISFTNSIAWDRIETVSIEIPFVNMAVYDYQLNPIQSQIVQRFDKSNNWYLYFQVATPALGISTYFIVILSTDGEILNDNSKNLPTPIQSILSISNELLFNDNDDETTTTTIGNSNFNLNFKFDRDNNNLLTLNSYDDLFNNKIGIPISQHLIEYTSLSDDAYKFRVQGLPIPLTPINPQFYLTIGPVVQIVTIIYNNNCSQSYLIYNDTTSFNPFETDNDNNNNSRLIKNDQYFEIDNIVASGWDKEISMKFTTNINNQNIFYTNNGLEIMKRQWEIHWNDTFIWSEITSNFYPMINTGYIVDQQVSDYQQQLTILSKQTFGASSQTNGEFEVLLIRRSNYTQWSVHEPMNDTSNPSLRVLCIFGDPNFSNEIRTPHSILFENPLQPVYSLIPNSIPIEKYIDTYNTLFKPLQTSLPYNLHLLTFTKQWIDSPSIIMRLINIYEIGQSINFSKSINFNIGSGDNNNNNNNNNNNGFLTHYNISQIIETTLSANSELSNPTNNLVITLEPLEIKTFLLTLSPKQ
ncbi:hypothetical protein DDB_G0278259 [Dictyostelium discoideum AX4]|uniref:Alpha-mannosidase B n=1 Tax=Dictyostelium discoideum TaxID=44689 RepID=MANB_DICDI|nr:hypothetical protein DDB_G0278259 [Dictyostelium discoideum AX4]Q54YF7.1 RecName: Full=Alpha-mannosidase B; Flags: Precursor [Dictyostelium discoideum]EAL68302.1 hypothetical protein DDB_G0278259 [Dictyostelium discoideum AX4]|eukprot:XP_642245.1 hypothetical protein DDB_G0278259 [Dictyostelium discoideum AX4]